MNTNRTIRKMNPRPHAPLAVSADVCYELRQIILRMRALTHDKVLRRSDLKKKCGRARSTSYVDEANGVFPPPFLIGKRAKGFSSNEIDAWIAAHSFASRSEFPVDMKAFVTLLVESRTRVPLSGPQDWRSSPGSSG